MVEGDWMPIQVDESSIHTAPDVLPTAKYTYLHRMKQWWSTLVRGRTIALIVSLVFLTLIVMYLTDIVVYVLIAWVLSILGSPVMELLKKVRIRGWIPGPSLRAALTLIGFFFLLGLLAWIFVPLMVTQAASISKVNYVAIAESLEEPLDKLNRSLAELGFETDSRSPSEQVLTTLRSWFEPGKVVDVFSALVTFAGNLVIGLFSIIFIAFFFLREEGLFKETVSSLVPREYQQQVQNVIDETSHLLFRYFGGVLAQITIIATLLTIMLSLAGVTNALLIAVFAAMFNVIPYVGPVIGAVFGVLMAISSSLELDFYSEMQPLLLWVVISFAIAQLVDNFFIQPFILGGRVLAHPLEIFILVLVAAKVGGIPGMILAIPSYTVLRVLARAFLSEFSLVQKLTRRMAEETPGKSTDDITP
jgi:predicted PurR-regulated permease PerM